MAKLADAIALGAIGVTLGGSSPLPPINFSILEKFTSRATLKGIHFKREAMLRW